MRTPILKLVGAVHGRIGQEVGQLLRGLALCEVVAGALLLARGLHQLLRGRRCQAVRRNGAENDAAQDACCIVIVLQSSASGVRPGIGHLAQSWQGMLLVAWGVHQLLHSCTYWAKQAQWGVQKANQTLARETLYE